VRVWVVTIFFFFWSQIWRAATKSFLIFTNRSSSDRSGWGLMYWRAPWRTPDFHLVKWSKPVW
jgi:hypothetical protein